jgi:hypothetical protein
VGFRSLRCRFDSYRGYRSEVRCASPARPPLRESVGAVFCCLHLKEIHFLISGIFVVYLFQMTSLFLYIGPGMGVGTLILVLLISAIVLLAVGYTVWARIKRIFKK